MSPIKCPISMIYMSKYIKTVLPKYLFTCLFTQIESFPMFFTKTCTLFCSITYTVTEKND